MAERAPTIEGPTLKCPVYRYISELNSQDDGYGQEERASAAFAFLESSNSCWEGKGSRWYW